MKIVPSELASKYSYPTADFFTYAGMPVAVGSHKGKTTVSQPTPQNCFINGYVVFGGEPGNPVCIASHGIVNFNLENIDIEPGMVFVEEAPPRRRGREAGE